MTQIKIVSIGQADFGGAGCSKHLGNDRSGNTFIPSLHAHNSDEVQFELKVSHGNSNMESRALFPRVRMPQTTTSRNEM
jgi:hypothetical protein